METIVSNYLNSFEKQKLEGVQELKLEDKRVNGVKQRELQRKAIVEATLQFLKTSEKGIILTIYTPDRAAVSVCLLDILKSDNELDYEPIEEIYHSIPITHRQVQVYYKEKKYIILIKNLN